MLLGGVALPLIANAIYELMREIKELNMFLHKKKPKKTFLKRLFTN